MSLEPVDVAFTPEPADYANGFALMYLRGRKRWRVVVLILLPFLAFAYFWLLGLRVAAAVLGVATMVWSVWLLTGGHRFFSGVIARRLWRTVPGLRENRRYRIAATGIEIDLGDAHSSMPWRFLIGFSRDQHGLILYDAPRSIRPFPARAVSVDQLDRIEALARQAGLPEI